MNVFSRRTLRHPHSRCGGAKRLSPHVSHVTHVDRLEDRRLLAVVAAVDWSVNTGHQAAPLHFGVNVWRGMEPVVATSASYKAGLSSLAPGMLRLHAAEQLRHHTQERGWLDHYTPNADGHPSWHRASVEAVVKNVKAGDAARMLTITGWPSTMDQNNDGRLDVDRYGDFARWCAELVTMVKNAGEFVRYWEPFNEMDNRGRQYSSAADGRELGKIFKLARDAMVAADSRILVGGHAGRDPWNDTVHEPFLAEAAPKLGFASYHQYGTGESRTDTPWLYDRAANSDGGLRNFRSDVRRLVSTTTPIFIGEANIYATWDRDTAGYMRSGVGAAWNALMLAKVVESGMSSGVAIWNDADGTYGVLDPANSYNRRPVGNVLNRLNKIGTGQIKTHSSNDATKLDVYAVENGAWKTVMLTNRTGSPVVSRLDMGGWLPGAQAKRYTITGSGEATAFISNNVLTGDYTVPAHGVVFYRIPRSGTQMATSNNLGGVVGQTVSLKAAANDRFVAAENGGANNLLAIRTAVGLWERFDLVNAGNGQIALFARVNSRYVVAENAGLAPLVANRTAVGAWERFTPVQVSGGYALLAEANGRFVALDGQNQLVATATSAAAGAAFTFALA